MPVDRRLILLDDLAEDVGFSGADLIYDPSFVQLHTPVSSPCIL